MITFDEDSNGTLMHRWISREGLPDEIAYFPAHSFGIDANRTFEYVDMIKRIWGFEWDFTQKRSSQILGASENSFCLMLPTQIFWFSCVQRHSPTTTFGLLQWDSWTIFLHHRRLLFYREKVWWNPRLCWWNRWIQLYVKQHYTILKFFLLKY